MSEGIIRTSFDDELDASVNRLKAGEPAAEDVKLLTQLSDGVREVAKAMNEGRPVRVVTRSRSGVRTRTKVEADVERETYAEADAIYDQMCDLFSVSRDTTRRTSGRLTARLEEGGMAWASQFCGTRIRFKELYQALSSLEGKSGLTVRSSDVLKQLIRARSPANWS